jgi:hypothetical protein
MTKQNLFISFSGGETSAFMAQWLLRHARDQFADVVTLFANTGQETEETLDFVQRCNEHFGLDVVWVEADVSSEHGVGTGFRVVDHSTASRQGEPFEDVIRKYGIPNQAYPHCTRELKLQPMNAYVRSLGWRGHKVAVGIRVDEIDRMSIAGMEAGIIYPLIKQLPTTKADVNAFWERQPFRLTIPSWEGNCKWCWKKSTRKHAALINDHPDWYDFPERMEEQYGLAGSNTDGTPRVFFRGHLTTKDMRRIAQDATIARPDDDRAVYQMDLLGLDQPGGGCSESCEPFAFGDE